MFPSLRRRRPADSIRFARIRFLRSIALPVPAPVSQDELMADAQARADRMHAAGALDRFTPHAYDAELDARLADAVTALRTASMEQADVEDRLVDQARGDWRRERLERVRLEDELARRCDRAPDRPPLVADDV